MEYFITLIFLLSNLFLGFGASSDKNAFLACVTQTLNSSPSPIIYTPHNQSYSVLAQPRNLRQLSNTRQRPVAIIVPRSESQIQTAIHCSKRHGVQIRVRSGGHDYEGLSYVSQIPFFTLDMQNFRSITIDEDDRSAWIQVGATLGELYHAIARRSRTLAFTAGVCPTVGVGGHFSGGGYGMMSRRFGIAADHIIDARVMNSDGQIMDRKSMGEDLFWAIRGGGGTSFGIVLAFKVNLIVVPETVTVFNVTRTLEQNATQLVHRWQYIADKIDDNLLLRLFLRSSTSPVTGKRTVTASFTSMFVGPVEDLLPIMQEKFPELGLKEEDCTEMRWIESILFFAGIDEEQSVDVLLNRTQQGQIYYKGKSDFVRQPIPEKGLRGIWEFLKKEDENRAELQFSPYGGRLNDVSEWETPFPHRSGTIFMIHYGVSWLGNGTSAFQEHVGWIRELYGYMSRYVSKSPRAAYFNYRDLDIGVNNPAGNTSYAQASVWGKKYFNNNFDRLVRVKTEVDPSNFFRNEQSIPPLVH